MNRLEEMVDDKKLTPEEIAVITETWLMVGDSVEMAIDLYNRLFYLHPSIRPLFKENIQLQARKFTAHIGYVVTHLNEWSRIQPDINELGQRHTGYEVKTAHYEYVGDALIFALQRHLKGKWNEQVELAWIKFYRLVANQMMGSHHHPN